MSRTHVTHGITAAELAGAALANVHPFAFTSEGGYDNPASIAVYPDGIGGPILLWFEDAEDLGYVVVALRTLADRIEAARYDAVRGQVAS